MSFWMRSRDRSTRAVRLVSTAILRMPSKPATCPKVVVACSDQCICFPFQRHLFAELLMKHEGH